MRVLVLSWEYPPMTWGGLSYHVYRLTEELKKEVQEIHLLTQGEEESTTKEDHLFIHRVKKETVKSPDFLTGTMALNFQLLKKGICLLRERGPFQLIHVHDWLVIQAGSVLKHAFQIPLLVTIHATEHGRNHGIHNPLQRYINDLEWYATYEAWKVICCSEYMAKELKVLFQLPKDKILIIPNGVSPKDLQIKTKKPSFPSHFANPKEKLVFFVGRLVQEKGVQDLLRAIKILKDKGIRVKAIIAGKGPFKGELKSLAEDLMINEQVFFTGFIHDEMRNHLYGVADVAVFPSLYEPFGIVALEAMAAKTPVLVTAVGGLDEIIKDRENGMKVKPSDPHALSIALETLFRDTSLCERMVITAYQQILKDYSWSKIAEKTRDLYQDLLEEYQSTDWALKKKDWPLLQESWMAKDHPFHSIKGEKVLSSIRGDGS